MPHLCTGPEPAAQLDERRRDGLVAVAERQRREVGALAEPFHARLVRAAGNAGLARLHWDVTGRMRVVRRLDCTRAAGTALAG